MTNDRNGGMSGASVADYDSIVCGVPLTLGQRGFILNYAPDPKDKEAVQAFVCEYRKEFKTSPAGTTDIGPEKMQRIITNLKRKHNRYGNGNGQSTRDLLKKRKDRLKDSGIFRCPSKRPR